MTLNMLIPTLLSAPLSDAKLGGSKLSADVDWLAVDEPGEHVVHTDPYVAEAQENKESGYALGTQSSLEDDANIAAKTFGWNPQDALRHLVNQRLFSRLVTHIQEKTPAVFGASAYSRSPGRPAALWLKDDVPYTVKRQLNYFQQRSGVEVQIFNTRFSFEEQEERMDMIRESLMEQGTVVFGMDMRPGDTILVTVQASDKIPPSQPPKGYDNDAKWTAVGRERQALGGIEYDPVAKRILPSHIDAYGVIIVSMEGEVANQDFHAYGGRQVYGDSSQCTSGFSVYRVSDDRTGITTAGHCTGMHTFDAVSPESDFEMWHKGEHQGAYGDVEWKTTGHYELAEYYARPSQIRSVTSVTSSFSTDCVVCLYSRRQAQRTCDYVYSTSTSQGGDRRLVAMENMNGVPGDSGGPWSYGTEASGVVKGAKWSWFKWRDTFTKANLFNSALGVRVLTV